MRLALLVIAALAATAAAAPLARLSTLSAEETEQLFASYRQRFNKAYATPLEQRTRFEIFKAALARIDAKNAADPMAEYGLTKFSDMTPAEFRVRYLSHVKGGGSARPVHTPTPVRMGALPVSVDWRPQTGKYIGPVRNQGQCGSCWAFSTAEQVATNWALAGNNFTVLSVQQIIDCDQTDQGCNGGDTPTGYQYVISAGGLESESSYPYKAKDETCKFDAAKVVAKISSWKYITGSGDTSAENVLKLETQLTSSPISICVEADTWQDYTGGVVTSNCGTQLDHCVQLAGYDNSGSTPFWIIRNSWGTDWGISGYIYVGSSTDLCGVQKESTIAIV